ncbi:next to BRCA1 gene 1 protein isoform X4 [Peromyscus leucopus]|uniref:next to BRCA1 gene 1 protein isoform X4 n=1 Tax=Peromyscus leucopus TaxID=10041 RepID=UPI0010A12533|nr:next to BRCA1 gene 1 protein isoform X4 [Peromyscus leucopus]
MEPQVTLNVTFKNETQSFLVSDPANTTWADVEAMVKVSFDLNNIQIKYLDEENEEVSINSQGEYEEALKMAILKQGNLLQMQVHEGHHVVDEAFPQIVVEKQAPARKGKKPLAHYSSVVRVLGPDVKTAEEPVAQPCPRVPCDTDHPHEKPPDWFTSYLETFREQVVKETVEKLEQRLREKLFLQKSASEVSMPVPKDQFNWHLACSHCYRRIIGVRYQCSVCPAYNLCEDCEGGPYAHSRSHVLLKFRKPVVVPSDPFSHLKGPAPRLPPALEQIRLPLQPCAPVMPTLSAAFVDENLPDGTHLQPGTKFIKHWRMKNTGNVKWSADTKLKFMWGNLTLASAEKKDVVVPCLKAGHVGVVSVEFIAPTLEGTYTSHWRLSHKGQQFGPRVWCSIIVDSFPSSDSPDNVERGMITSIKADDLTCEQEEAFLLAEDEIPLAEVRKQIEGTGNSISQKTQNVTNGRELYIPSVDLLTAQDLLSFELLDINIVQELERVPHNTPVDMTPCMSPLPHDSPLIEKPGLGQIQEESEGAGFKALPDSTLSAKRKTEAPASVEETEEDLSGTQFVCETVIRSLTLDAAPDHNPPCRQRSLPREFQLQSTEEQQPAVPPGFCRKDSSLKFALPEEGPLGDEREEIVHIAEEEEEELQDEVESQSSASSEDYIIILPECFDTSRPLGDSMYSSALSQPGLERGAEGQPGIEAGQEPAEALERLPEGESQPQEQSISDILTTSQTLDTVPLVPEVVGLPPPLSRSSPCVQHGSPEVDSPVTIQEVPSVPDQVRGEPRGSSGLVNSRQKSCDHSRHHSGSGIAGGLVKGALSVAASAYKALFSGPPVTAQPIVSEDETAALMAHLFEMGFCDRQLNLRLLRKHNYNILQVVTELLHINNNDWYSHRY